jgi:hypothetical protein
MPTADGVEIHLVQDQRPQVITVPWPALSDVLAPGMADVAQN